MKKLLSILLFVPAMAFTAFSAPGDTVTVQTFTFGSPQDAWFVFPSDTVRFEKILMQYTLKCNPAQSPACGEWDYLTYSYLFKNTGLLDSTLIHQPIFTADGAEPSSIAYMNTPSWSYSPSWQYSATHTDTAALSTYPVGTLDVPVNYPFGAAAPVSRSQFLWKASEMSSAGMSAGNITGMRFYVLSAGSPLRRLSIKIKHSSLDSLQASSFSGTGFSTSYLQNTTLSSGWNSIQLTSPFNWDGTSNLLIEISYENIAAGTSTSIAAHNTSFKSALVNAGADRSFSFHTNGFVNVPVDTQMATLDSFVTVSYWAYGTPAYQPQDGTCFEAIDSSNNRILNAHMPWSDNNVYWDAGYGGTSYDRINKAATITEYEGQWNFWTFTKNIATGSMKIYLNGTLWHSGTGKIKPMDGIKTFRIGKGNWSGSQTYEGKIDEFAVFNKELNLAEIQWLMRAKVMSTDALYNNLVVYYHADEGNYISANDDSFVPNATAILNSVDNPLKSPEELLSGFTTWEERPAVIFEQGVFTTVIDTVMLVDSTMNQPVQLITYTDSISNPGVAIDTMIVWPAYYNNYVYDAAGNATDSTYVTPDSVFTQVYYDWYKKFPQVIRYELARYITPYGNGLSLGSGWTWTFDVSDYRTLLADSVHLAAGNWQELLDMKFLMIKGVPPRDVVGIQNLWNGSFNYGQSSDPIESHLTPKTLNIPSNAYTSRWKSRITGHGMDTPENCAEFCAKMHYFKVNGVQQFSKLVWRDNCDRNPLYPQGGTWVYDRANWCPGAEVWTYDFELTPFVTTGSPATLDHDVQPYTSTGGWDYYQIEDQLVSYGPPNFTLDAAIDDILSPSNNQMWLRYNPVCTNPVVRIRNTGSSDLTSLTITYGLPGATPSVYNWTGNLKFTETAEVTLGTFNWAQGASEFTVTVSAPNGGSDQYPNNNTKTSKFTYPPVMPPSFVIEFKTNLYPWENEYTLKDASGAIVLSRAGLSANITYKDTVTLADGCYTFELTDTGEDGLSWWANTAQGSGSIKFKKLSPATVLKNFTSDFGGQVYQQFTVGLTSNIDDYVFTEQSTLNVYPNPSEGIVTIDFDLSAKQDAELEVYDVMGKKVFSRKMSNVIAESISCDLSDLQVGMYFVTLRTGKDLLTNKVFIK
jgi:hypothetical protein